MRITCPGCSAEFNVDDGRIPPQGTTVRCPKCFKAVDVKPPSETESLDTALLGGAAVDDDPFSGEFTQPEADIPPAAMSEDAPAGPAPDAPAPPDAAPPPSTAHQGIPGGGLVDDVWAGAGEPKPKEPKGTSLGIASPASDPDVAPDDVPLEESIFDEGLSWSEERPDGVEAATPPAAEDIGAAATPPAAEDIGAAATPPAAESVVHPQVSGLGETMVAQADDIEDLEQALADLEATSGVMSEVDGDPVSAEPAPEPDLSLDPVDALAEGFDQLDEALAPREELTDAPADEAESGPEEDTFAPLGEGEEESFEIQRETISQDDIFADGEVEPPAQDAAGGRKFEGGGPTIDDIDFDSLLDDLPGDESGGDTFFVDSPEGGEGDAPAFDSPKDDEGSPFDMEEINFDNLDEFSDLGELSDTGSTAEADSAADSLEALELDMGDDVPAARAEPVPLPQDEPLPPPAQGEAAPRRRRPKKRSPMPLLVLVVVLGIGAAGVYMFGDSLMQLLSGDDKPSSEDPAGASTAAAAHTRGTMECATRADYDRRVETLEKEIELGKGNKTATEEELMWVLAWYHFGHPGAFSTGAPRTQRFESLRSQYAAEGTVFAKKIEAMDEASEGSWDHAKTTFAEYLRLRNDRQDELWQSDQQAMKAMVLEDELLEAWVLAETLAPNEARTKLEAYLKKQPGSLFGLYLEALILYKEGEQSRAETALGKVLDKHPTHVTSKILLTQIEIEQAKYDEAVAHAQEMVKAAVTQKDENLEMKAFRIIVQALSLKGDAGRQELKEVLEAVVAKRSNSEKMVVALSHIYLDADENERALATLTICKECKGEEYLLLLVKAMQRNGMLERALQTAQDALGKDTNNIDLLVLMSDVSSQTGRNNSAMDYLRDVLRLRPDHLDASIRLAKLYISIKQPANAREILLETEKYKPDNLQLEEMLVEINLQMNDDSGAASALRKVHTLKPNDVEVRLRLVELLVRLGNYKEAVPHFDVLVEKNLITPKLRPGYAMALREVGRMGDAVEMLKEVLRDDPSNYQTARNLATIYLGKKDYFKAREYLEMARRSRSKDPEVHHLIGTCCVKTEDMECALAAYTQAVELEPESLLYRTEYAKVVYRISETDEGRRKALQRLALGQFNKIVKRYESDPSIPTTSKDADIYASRGRIYFSLGYYDKALRDFHKAVAMDQHRVDLLLSMGDSLFHVNRRADAKKYYREVLDTGNNLAHANFYMGKIYMVENDPKKAKAHFLACIDADFEKFPDAHRYLGTIYKEARFRDMAIKYYQNYLDLVPSNTPQARDIQNTIQRMR